MTGASSGLGLAIAHQLRRTRHRLILTARDESLPRFGLAGIEESERVRIRPLDVTRPRQRRGVADEAEELWGGIDVLINNAGVSYRSVVEHVLDKDRLAQLDVNYLAPMELSRLVLPGMRERRWGRILNVSSVGGMMAMPTMAVYSASKFALEGGSEALWYEVRPWNIHVSLIQPGFINSGSFERVRYTWKSDSSSHEANDPYFAHYRDMASFIERLMRLSPSTPEKVARTVLRTIESDRPALRVPATLDAHLFSMLRRLLPRGVYHWLLYRSLPNVEDWGR